MTDSEKLKHVYDVYISHALDIRDQMEYMAMTSRLTTLEEKALTALNLLLEAFEDPLPELPDDVKKIMAEINKPLPNRFVPKR